jgi:hypothetical protein
MKKLREAEARAEAALNSLKQVREALNSYEGLSLRNQLLIDFLEDMKDFVSPTEKVVGLEILSVETSVSRAPKIRLASPSVGYYWPWEAVGDLVNGVYLDSALQYRVTKTGELNGVIFEISDFVAAKMEEDDIRLLKMLGKIEEDYIPGHVENRLICGSN